MDEVERINRYYNLDAIFILIFFVKINKLIIDFTLFCGLFILTHKIINYALIQLYLIQTCYPYIYVSFIFVKV